MAERIEKAFGVSGDKTSVPTDSTGTELSFDKGWTSVYELEVGVDAGARDIDRAQHNQLWNTVTSNIKEWQEKAFPEYYSDIEYKKGTPINYNGVSYICMDDATAGTLPTNASYFTPWLDFIDFGSAAYLDAGVSGSVSTISEILVVIDPQLFTKTITSESAFKLDATSVKLNCDISVAVGSVAYEFSEDSTVALPATMNVGTDYAIYATADGLISTDNFTFPTGYDSVSSRRIGGFHYQDGMINEYSFYDLKYKPNVKDPRGMVRSPMGIWADIYLTNTTPDLLGTSAYNATIADGSSAPKVPSIWGGDGSTQYDDFSQYTAARVLAAYGKRLPNSNEFEQISFGSVTGHAVGSDPVTTKFDASAKSMIGCEQVSGHMWQWGSERWDRGNGSSGYAWYAADTDNEGSVNTSGSSGVGAVALGGYWMDSSNSGARASVWSNEPWSSNTNVGARGVCGHFESC